MVNDPSFSDTETLGHFLQRQRTEKGVELHEVAEETKIPPGTLRAMENGDFSALPADAFARGFYSIYARLLELDVNSILERYTKERGISLINQKITVQTPSRLGDSVSPMAERPLVTPLSVFSFALVVIVLAIAGICWYLSWNPANFLSERLRSLGKGPAVEQKKESSSSSESPVLSPEAIKALSPETIANGQAPADGRSTAGANTGKYTLQAEFQESTKVTVNTDEEFPEELTFSAGQTHSWHAKGTIVLALPPTTKTRLSLNGVVIPLPEPVDGFITVSIPGSQLK
jgi:cytoskeletal protein RodZ